MKIWLKLLIASGLGLALGFLLPSDNEGVLKILGWLEQFALHLGRYSAMPLLFFGLVVAIYELRLDKDFWPLAVKCILTLVCVSAVVVFLGIGATLLFPPARIPIQIAEQVDLISLNLGAVILRVFPDNMFAALLGDGTFILPLCAMAFFIGLGLSFDRNNAKQLIALTESLSRAFYHIAAFFTEIIALTVITLSAYWAARYHAVMDSAVFRDLLLLLGILAAALVFIIFPLILYIIHPKANPWSVIYGLLAPALAAFFSGDLNFTLPLIIRHVKENLGVRRRANAVTVSFFAVFGRAGSAMVAAVSFIVIIKSYSSLGISLNDVAAIGLRAFFISFLLAAYPGTGAFAALAALGSGFGRGFDSGYLNLKPIAFYLVSVGTFIDVMICSFASYAIAKTGAMQEDKNARYFI
jgi:Na+/H+-dicarboxylate symporter